MTPLFFRSILPGVLLAGALACLPQAAAQAPADAPLAQAPADAPLQISWEVKNRFRLFREQRDFQLHVDAMRERSVLAAEQSLELQGEGRGWACNMVNRSCLDLTGVVSDPVTRDNVKERFLRPGDHPIVV